MTTDRRFLLIDCLGVKISITSNRAEIIKRVKKQLVNILPIEFTEFRELVSADFQFTFNKNNQTGRFNASKNSESIFDNLLFARALDLFASSIRLTIAEFSEQLIFLHAGVVGYRGRALVIPGKSFAGKTTLVAELVKRGCVYFSDEYALIDQEGLVHAFPKKLSMRGIIDDYTQVDWDVKKIGGEIAEKPFPVGWLLVAEFDRNKKSAVRFRKLLPGQILMACIANSISIRQNPKLVLSVLTKALQNSAGIKTRRGEVAEFATRLLRHLDQKIS